MTITCPQVTCLSGVCSDCRGRGPSRTGHGRISCCAISGEQVCGPCSPKTSCLVALTHDTSRPLPWRFRLGLGVRKPEHLANAFERLLGSLTQGCGHQCDQRSHPGPRRRRAPGWGLIPRIAVFNFLIVSNLNQCIASEVRRDHGV